MTKAKSLGAEGIALGACYQNAAAIAKEMAEAGPKGSDHRRRLRRRAGLHRDRRQGCGRHLHVDRRLARRPSPGGPGLTSRRSSRGSTAQLPPYSGPRSYDIVYSFKYCFEKAGITNKPADLDSDRDKIRECLGTLKDFPGVAGPITMDAVRDGTGITAILKVVNGKYVNIAEVIGATRARRRPGSRAPITLFRRARSACAPAIARESVCSCRKDRATTSWCGQSVERVEDARC